MPPLVRTVNASRSWVGSGTPTVRTSKILLKRLALIPLGLRLGLLVLGVTSLVIVVGQTAAPLRYTLF